MDAAYAKMARPAGVEPATSCLEGTCSIQLSYGRVAGEIAAIYRLWVKKDEVR